MKPKAQVEYRAIADLKELPGNPRTIKKDQFEKLKTSIKDNADYFEARPIILSDRTGELVILAGNQRYKAAKAIGLKEVPTILLPNLTEEREKEIIIRDNVENGDWDWDALANEWDADVLESWGVKMPVWDENQTEYQQFVDKFKPKLTTDDCFTPPEVFKAVEKWVREEYKLGDIENIRPFKPEGDYQAENYDGKVVIDNPPFSILSEIVRWYTAKGVKFFLFAPYLSTLLIAPDCQTTKIITGGEITYENGAKVLTNFVTNMADPKVLIKIAGTLNEAIEASQAEANEQFNVDAYERPQNLKVGTDLVYVARLGHDWELTASDCECVKNSDGLKAMGKGLYGGGLLVSDTVAQKLEQEKKLCDEQKFAKMAKKLEARNAARSKMAKKIELSDREKAIVARLNGEAA